MSLSKDLVYPPCPHCERNIDGFYTERKGDESWYCIRCETLFACEWNPQLYTDDAGIDEWRIRVQ